jgi:intein/homing endonuclease
LLNLAFRTAKLEDIDILLKINKLISKDNLINIVSREGNRKQQAILNIYNMHISQILEKHGVINNKTFNVQFPKWLNNNLHHHFIRGVFDGDGCIFFQNNKWNTCGFNITGTEDLLINIQDILIRNCNLNKTKLIKRFKDKNDNITSLEYGGNIQCKRIFDWIYKDANLFLYRKYEKYYNKFIKAQEETKEEDI